MACGEVLSDGGDAMACGEALSDGGDVGIEAEAAG